MSRKMIGRFLLLASIFVLSGGCATGQGRAIQLVSRAVEQGRYGEALDRLSIVERYTDPTDEQKAEIVYWRARSHEGLKNHPEAIALYRYIVRNFPDSRYAGPANEKLRQIDGGEGAAGNRND